MAKKQESPPEQPPVIVPDAEVLAEAKTTAMAPQKPQLPSAEPVWDIVEDNDLARATSGQSCFVGFPKDRVAAIMLREKHDVDKAENAMEFVNTVLTIVSASLGRLTIKAKDEVSESGEVVEGGEVDTIRLCLELADGSLVNMFSKPAARDFSARLRTHLQLHGQLSAEKPLRLLLKRLPTSNARSMYSLQRP